MQTPQQLFSSHGQHQYTIIIRVTISITNTSGFYFGELDTNSENLDGGYYGTHRFLGHIVKPLGNNEYLIDVKDKIVSGSTIEVLTPSQGVKEITFKAVSDKTGDGLEVAQPNMKVRLLSSEPFEAFDVLRQIDTDSVHSYQEKTTTVSANKNQHGY